MTSPSPRPAALRGQLVSFALIGLGCTAAFAVLYALLRAGGLAPLAANAAALGLTMGVNFAANRRFTFAATEGPILRQLGGYVVAYGVGLAASSAGLVVLTALLHHPTGLLDVVTAVAAGLLATAVRFVLMRRWVFREEAAGY